MDSKRFDRVSRLVGEQTDRRGMFKVAAGSALGVLGLSALGRAVAAQDVTAEASGFLGDPCQQNNDCKKGLECDRGNDTCRYRAACGGKKDEACQEDRDCCGRLKCKGQRCKGRNKKRR